MQIGEVRPAKLDTGCYIFMMSPSTLKDGGMQAGNEVRQVFGTTILRNGPHHWHVAKHRKGGDPGKKNWFWGKR